MSASICEDCAGDPDKPGVFGNGFNSDGSPSRELGTGRCDAAMSREAVFAGFCLPCVPTGDAVDRALSWKYLLIGAVDVAFGVPLVFIRLRYVMTLCRV